MPPDAPIPLSPAFSLLIPALAGLWLAGRWLARRATDDRPLALWLAPGLAVALWILSVHAVGLALQAFAPALWVGTLLPALAGLATRLLSSNPPPEGGLRPSRWIWVGILFAVAALTPMVLRWPIHDSCIVTGHMSIPLQIQNGIYPPRHLSFPRYELRYHYGFDLLSALVSTLFRLRMDRTLELLTLLCWGYSAGLLWLFGDRMLGRGGGPLASLLTLFGGGVPYLCDLASKKPLSLRLIGECRIRGLWLLPPFTSSFLQHPWTLGFPLALCLLLLLRERPRRPGPLPDLVLVLLFVALAFSQVVLFACLLGAGAAAGAFRGFRLDRRETLRLAGVVIAAGLLARAAHGFFAPTLEPTGLRLVWSPFWIGGDRANDLAWHAESFGLFLPLGLAGLFFARGERLRLGLLAVGSFAVLELFHYPNSWDIVKFGMVAQIALALLAAAALHRLLRIATAGTNVALEGSGSSARAPMRWAAALALAVALLGATSAGFAYPTAMGGDMKGIWFCHELPNPATLDDAHAIAWLRGRVGPGELVFRSQGAEAYAVWGGLPQSGVDWGAETFGFSPRLFQQRQALIARPPVAPGPYLDEGIRWFVLGPSDDRMTAIAAGWIGAHRAAEVARFGSLRIVRLE